MSFFYLASPYSHKDPWVMEHRVLSTMQAVAQLLSDGHVIYSPICHHHTLAKIHGLPHAWEFWRKQDFGLLHKCDGLLILQLPGWQESVGVSAEIAEAKIRHIPITFLETNCARLD
jgi:hypothetical protein